MPIRGFSPERGSRATSTRAMPWAAPAALARIFRVKAFSPRMSPTENIMVTSLMST